jgi:phosphoglycolate phosphatase
MTKQRVTAIIFDLDGTLVDSLPGIEASLRVAVATCNPPRQVPALRGIIGPPIAQMIARLWPDLADAQRACAVAAFRRHYDSEGCLLSPLFDGVLPTLSALQAHGIELFLLTNKPQRPTQTILEQTAMRQYLRDAVSPDTNDPPFAVKSAGALWLRARYSLRRETTLVVGDGLDDAEAAAECGFGFVAAAYGYGGAAQRSDLHPVAVLETFSAIREIVL